MFSNSCFLVGFSKAEFIYFPHCVSQLYFSLREKYNFTHWQAIFAVSPGDNLCFWSFYIDILQIQENPPIFPGKCHKHSYRQRRWSNFSQYLNLSGEFITTQLDSWSLHIRWFFGLRGILPKWCLSTNLLLNLFRVSKWSIFFCGGWDPIPPPFVFVCLI